MKKKDVILNIFKDTCIGIGIGYYIFITIGLFTDKFLGSHYELTVLGFGIFFYYSFNKHLKYIKNTPKTIQNNTK